MKMSAKFNIQAAANACGLDWSRLDNKTLLITGATGLVGKRMIELILERNQLEKVCTKVVAVGRSRKKLEERFAAFAGDPCLEFYEHDVQEPWQYDEPVDYIFHMASNTHPLQYAMDPIATEMTNILGTHYLLALAARNPGCRFVFTSTTDIYGDNRTGKEFLEETDCGYIDCNTLRANYIEGKRASEALCNAYRKQHGVDFVIGRICRLFGDTMQMEDSKAVSSFIKNAAQGEDILLKSAGTQIYSFLYVDDAVTGMLKIAAEGESGNAYNVAANDYRMTLMELAKTLAKIGGTKVTMGDLSANEKAGASGFQNACLDGAKLASLGWKPAVPLVDGLRMTVDYLKTKAVNA